MDVMQVMIIYFEWKSNVYNSAKFFYYGGEIDGIKIVLKMTRSHTKVQFGAQWVKNIL